MTREEAIQNIKSWDFLGEKEREAVETLVPELKESEGEKIKKQIIYAIKQLPICNETKSKCIAWLEKKGGCKMSHDDEIMIKQLTEYFTTGFGLQNTNETIVAWLRDLKEKLSGLGEQKSVNSTLQEKADIDNAFTEMMLKDEQKTAEWSDEDCVMQRAALEILMASPKLVASTILKESVIVWLKFLRTQSIWKPSKEQLRELRCVISGCSFETPILVELEEQLKKL